jgi:hypothetical protein
MGEKWEDRRRSDRVGTSEGLFVDTSGKFVDPSLGKEGSETKEKYAFVKGAIEAFKSTSSPLFHAGL